MENGTYAQINYNPDDLEDVSVTKVDRKESPKQIFDKNDTFVNEEKIEQKPEIAEEFAKEDETSTVNSVNDETLLEIEQVLEKAADEIANDDLSEKVSEEESEVKQEGEFQETVETEEETALEEASETESEKETETAETLVQEPEPMEQRTTENLLVLDEVQELLKKYTDSTEDIQRTLRRLEMKFEEEILNGENRDSSVKTIYKELNEYKAGIVEKALKNVLYDMIDIRETMLSQIKYLREKMDVDSISLEEFESYANDIGDILEKHDVVIYKGKTGEENVAVRQKIVRKVETEDENLVKKVAESLSSGYEYGSKILYPEKISVYIKKK